MVYEPQEDSYLLLKHVKKLAYGKVIDIGTGSGIVAEGAAKNPGVKKVYAVDIDEEAISQLRKKKIDKVKAFKSNLFASVSEKFDVIIFNPPYLPSEEKDEDVALDGGRQGYELINKFLKQAKNHLIAGGFILMVFSNRTGKEKVDESIKAEGYDYELLEKKSLAFFEELYAYKVLLSGRRSSALNH
jgi:release factor glutamine methyltransferase